MYFQEGPAGYGKENGRCVLLFVAVHLAFDPAKKVAEFTLVLSDERVEDTVTILTS